VFNNGLFIGKILGFLPNVVVYRGIPYGISNKEGHGEE